MSFFNLNQESHVLSQRELEEVVDKLIQKIGKKIVLGLPLGLAKPVAFVNALYQRAIKDPTIDLKIFTALTLEKLNGPDSLTQNFLNPYYDRVMKDFEELDYAKDRRKNCLPKNVKIIEFFHLTAKLLHNQHAQQNYISSNYTYVLRDLMDHGVNVLATLVAHKENNGKNYLSLSSNPDISIDLIQSFKKFYKREDVFLLAQVNPQLPFLEGEAQIDFSEFDYVLKPSLKSDLYALPKQNVSFVEHCIGLWASALIPDGGTLQLGIGSLSDAVIHSLKIKHHHNDLYRSLIEKKYNYFKDDIDSLGSLDSFEEGLFGHSEMLVDGFLDLMESQIIKRKVYDDESIQSLLNQKKISEKIGAESIQVLVSEKVISSLLSYDDFQFLKKWGFVDESLKYESGKVVFPDLESYIPDLKNKDFWNKLCQFLGKNLKSGHFIHAGFFLGPQVFYKKLRDMTESQIKNIRMKSIRWVNHLYGHENLARLQRKKARFINSCLMVTLNGDVASDALENGQVISGVGGQYDFAAQAHALDDGRFIVMLPSTRFDGKKLRSNILWSYGNIALPTHLRDIVITEYGIANLRGQTDEGMIKKLLNITDSRFQDELMDMAKKNGKLAMDYQIPDWAKKNTLKNLEVSMKMSRRDFPPFPLANDMTEEERIIMEAFSRIKVKKKNLFSISKKLIKSFFVDYSNKPTSIYLNRLHLLKAKTVREKITREFLVEEITKLSMLN